MIDQAHKHSWGFILLSAIFIGVLTLSLFTGNYFFLFGAYAFLLGYAGWQNTRVVFYLMLLSLPLSFEYNFTDELGTDIPDEFLMLLVTLLSISYWICFPKSISKEMLNHPVLLLLLLSFAWTVLTVLFSTHEIISLKFILAKTWYLGAFVLAPLLLLKDKRSIGRAAITLTASLLIVVIIILARHSSHDFSFGSINDVVNPFFRNHVNYSAMVVCMIPVLVAGWTLAVKKSTKVFLVVIILLFILATFFSFARGAWLALLIGGVSWWLIRIKALVTTLILIVIFCISTLFYLKQNDRYLKYANDFNTTIFHENFKEHIVATYKLKDVSTAERFYRWIAGVRMIPDKWVTGHGPGTFYSNYKPYALPAFKTWVSDNKERSTVHNYFLLVAVEQGIPGIFFFLLLLGVLLYYSQHLYHRIRDAFYKTVAITIGVILTMLMTVNFLSDLIETDKVGSIFFLCLSLLVIVDVHARKQVN